MSDVQGVARLVYEHQLTGRSCMGCKACPGLEFQNAVQHAEHVTELIATEYLVVPRSDVVGTEYAYSPAPGHVQLLDERDRVAWTARNYGGEALERPVLAWSPSLRPEARRPGEYLTLDRSLATELYGFPPVPRTGESHTAPDGTVWVFELTGPHCRWELSQRSPEDGGRR